MSTPTATPRTTAALEWVRPAGNDSGPPNEQYIAAEVSFKLETELAAAKAECERLMASNEEALGVLGYGPTCAVFDVCQDVAAELAAERERLRVLREDIQALAHVSRNNTATRSQLRDMIAAIDQRRRAERAEAAQLDAVANADLAMFRMARIEAERDALAKDKARLIEALTRLRDCDWVISLPDRMDAVRDIARAALDAAANAEAKAAMKATT